MMTSPFHPDNQKNNPVETPPFTPEISTQEMMDKISEAGYRTKITHFREVKMGNSSFVSTMGRIRATGEQDFILSRGGITVASVKLDEFTYIECEARCNPKDKYNRKEGANRALFRAYTTLKMLKGL